MPPTQIPELGRLRWRCRRGMRELDELLGRYLEGSYPGASPGARQAFRELLEAPDPLIYAYCMGQVRPPTPDLAALIERITSGAAGRP